MSKRSGGSKLILWSRKQYKIAPNRSVRCFAAVLQPVGGIGDRSYEVKNNQDYREVA